MTKMTPEEVTFAFEVLAEEKHHSSVFRASERIRQHVLALEAEVAQAREMALNEVRKDHATRHDAAKELGDYRGAQVWGQAALAIDALKLNPAQEVKQPPVMPPDDYYRAITEMASEENGLLPKRRRREHEYGEERQSHFGSFTAWCVRSGCEAYRVKNRTKTRTSFMQSPHARPTAEPGPCEVKP